MTSNSGQAVADLAQEINEQDKARRAANLRTFEVKLEEAHP
jgi:hypothetical protein